MKLNKKRLTKSILLTCAVAAVSIVVPCSIISCSNNGANNDSLNTLQKQFNNWDMIFNKKYNSNFNELVSKDINTNIDNASKSWNDFTNAYEQQFKTKKIKIDWNNYDLYINNFSIKKNSLTFNTNQTFNLNLTWTLNLSISEANIQPNNSFYLIINENFVNATLKPTLIVSWPDILNTNIEAYGGFYINSIQKATLNVKTSQLNISNYDLTTAKPLQDLLNNLPSNFNDNLTLNNPSSTQWVAPSFITPILNYSKLNNELNSLSIISQKDINNLKILGEIFTPGIYGIDYYINAKGYQYSSVPSNNQTTFSNVVNKLEN
ncbi:MAG: hypothetical protein IIT97_02250 [Mycoplasmataceae bacterium]|nr:hypothetical protein [Mycoplasmataceae bacterium]